MVFAEVWNVRILLPLPKRETLYPQWMQGFSLIFNGFLMINNLRICSTFCALAQYFVLQNAKQNAKFNPIFFGHKKSTPQPSWSWGEFFI